VIHNNIQSINFKNEKLKNPHKSLLYHPAWGTSNQNVAVLTSASGSALPESSRDGA